MRKGIRFDVIKKDFGLDEEQTMDIIHLVHALCAKGASRKLVYNEITTKNYTRKELDFALMVMGFYEALTTVGVEIIDE